MVYGLRLVESLMFKMMVNPPRGRLRKTKAGILFFRVIISQSVQIKTFTPQSYTWEMVWTFNFSAIQMSFLFLDTFCCSVISTFKVTRCQSFRRKPRVCSAPLLYHRAGLEKQCGRCSHSWGNNGVSLTFFTESTFGWTFVAHIHVQ